MIVERLRSEILKLSKAERIELAHFLLDSIINAEDTPGTNFSTEQLTEIQKRLEAFEKGEMDSAPSKEILDWIRQKKGFHN